MRSIDQKAIRLCLEDRVTVQWHNGTDAASGVVDGETDTYQVSYSPQNRVCTCLAGQNHRTCSHVMALELQVLREAEVMA